MQQEITVCNNTDQNKPSDFVAFGAVDHSGSGVGNIYFDVTEEGAIILENTFFNQYIEYIQDAYQEYTKRQDELFLDCIEVAYPILSNSGGDILEMLVKGRGTMGVAYHHE